MTSRGLYTLLFGAVMLFTALSVGSEGAFVLGAAALLAWLLSLVCVLASVFASRFHQELDACQVTRGDSCRYRLSVRLLLPLPIAPLSLLVSLPSGRTSEFLLATRLFGTTLSDNSFPCPHVGVYPAGLLRVTYSDCFGLFSISRRSRLESKPVCVLPRPAQVRPLRFSPGEGETGSAQRAQADRTTPADIRTWQDGDDLKRVHWKLSMRRQELMVHTYETPQRPDALILLNCSLPASCTPAQRALLRDSLTEVCAGAVKGLLEEQHIVRLPLSGSVPREMSGQDSAALPGILEALAQTRFDQPVDFTRELLLSSRRMRRTGSTAVISAQITPAMADAVIALSGMGPHMRFTLVVCAPLTQEQEKLLYLLVSSGVEATHVSARA